jgi:hypothetical protein
MSPTADQLVDTYLERLDAELGALPPARRREVVEEISEHIAEARSDPAAQSEAGIRNVLERLGDPADIAAEARERFGVQPRKPGWLEIGALVLLLVGGFAFLVGWLVGVVLLWTSNVWTARDKLIGTLVVPGGLALPLGFLVVGVGSGTSCTGRIGPGGKVVAQACTGGHSGSHVLGLVALVVLLLAPFATTVYLSRRMRARTAHATV